MWMPTRTSPPAQILDREGVVKILRVVRVDREDGDPSVVEPALQLPRADAVGKAAASRSTSAGKFGSRPCLTKMPRSSARGSWVRPRRPVISPTRGCSRRRHSPSLTTTLSPGCGHRPHGRPGRVRNGDLVDETGVVGGDDEVPALAPQVADDRRVAALDDLDDAADALAGALARDAAVDPRRDRVARKGDARVIGGDLDRGLVPVSADDDEGGSTCSELNYAFDSVIGLGALAARLDVWHFLTGPAFGESTALKIPQGGPIGESITPICPVHHSGSRRKSWAAAGLAQK